jgi:hypothetical protein
MLHRVLGPNGNNMYNLLTDTDKKAALEKRNNYGRLWAKYMHT